MAKLGPTLINGSLRANSLEINELYINNYYIFINDEGPTDIDEDSTGLCTGDQVFQYINYLRNIDIRELPLAGGTLTYDFGRIIFSYEEEGYLDEEDGPYRMISVSVPEIENDGGGEWLILTDYNFENFIGLQATSVIYDETEDGRLKEYIEDQTVTDYYNVYDACLYLFIREDEYYIFDSQEGYVEGQRDEDLLYDYKFKITLENGTTWKFMRLQ